MPTDQGVGARPHAGVRRLGTSSLWLSAAGAILLLGACAADREGGTANYPDRWEYRQGPSYNYGKIHRY